MKHIGEQNDVFFIYSGGNPQANNRVCGDAVLVAEYQSHETVSADMADEVGPVNGAGLREPLQIQSDRNPACVDDSEKTLGQPDPTTVSLHESHVPHTQFTEPALVFTIPDEQLDRAKKNADPDGVARDIGQLGALAIPSGREVTSELVQDRHTLCRQNRRTTTLFGWRILVGSMVTCVAALFFASYDQETDPSPEHKRIATAAGFQENQRTTLERQSAILSSPKHWVEPPWEHSSQIPVTAPLPPFPNIAQTNAQTSTRTANLSINTTGPLTEPTTNAPAEKKSQLFETTSIDNTARAGTSAKNTTPNAVTESGSQRTPSSSPQMSNSSDNTFHALDMKRLVAKGDELLGLGDVASARLVYRLAVSDGNATAAISMGSTYDPKHLEISTFEQTSPNPIEAIKWYKMAISMGEQSAEIRLRNLVASVEKPRSMRTPAQIKGRTAPETE